MKVSFQWIREYVDLPDALTMEQLGYDLTMRTVEVEGWEDLGRRYDKIVAGRIVAVAPHPSADRLRVTQVDVGLDQPVQIVCGGINLEKGQMVVVTLPGSYAVWHGEGEPVLIGESELRGVSSYGMICGANEVGLSALFPAREEHEIIDLKGIEAFPGQPIADVLGLNDQILEIDNKSLTNRPDLWGHYGIARELAAIYGCPLKALPQCTLPESLPAYPVRIEDADRCRRYFGMEWEGVDARKSPLWLQVALMKVDVRPINALVDITNYVMLSTGQPTHAFDRARIHGGIVVRPAGDGETLRLLDDTELTLDPSHLVIADAEKAVGLAGIMGGSEDSVLESTEGIVFEIANFAAAPIRRTAQLFGLRTESSMRFEKGVDSQRVDLAKGLAIALLTELFPAARATAQTDLMEQSTLPPTIRVSLDWLSRRLGTPVSFERVEQLLRPLGFELQREGDAMQLRVPSWRGTGDVSLPDDILEEVARMIGYENFEKKPLQVTLTHAVKQPRVELDRRLREYLAFRCGFTEIFTYPWVQEHFIKASGLSAEGALYLAEGPSPEERTLRFSLVPGMIEATVKNLRYFDQFRIFELTQVFRKGACSPSSPDEVLPEQHRVLTGALVGEDAARLFFEGKGVLEQMGRFNQIPALSFRQDEKPAWADRKAWLSVYSGETRLGDVGLLSPMVKLQAGIRFRDVCLFELNVELLEPFASRANSFVHLPQYPHVWQDLSVLVDEQCTWAEVAEAVSPLVCNVEYIDEYRGVQIPLGMKSLTLRVELGSSEGTLSNQQIEAGMAQVREALSALGARVREV